MGVLGKESKMFNAIKTKTDDVVSLFCKKSLTFMKNEKVQTICQKRVENMTLGWNKNNNTSFNMY